MAGRTAALTIAGADADAFRGVEVVLSNKLITAFSLLGLLRDAVSIETRGPTAATISNLSQSNARQLRRVLQSLER